MDLTIIRKNGDVLNTKDYNIKVLKFNKGFPTIRHETEKIEDREGFIDLGSFYEDRQMSASCYFYGVDNLDTPLVQNDIFKLFDSRESFYLIDSREPGKQWEVKTDSQFTMDQRIATFGTFEITFIGKPYALSVASTITDLSTDADAWQIGQGLVIDDSIDYTFTTSSFQIFNAGDVPVDPRTDEIEITFTGASSNLTITNNTTGDVWNYTETSNASDVIRLTGIRSTKNNISIFGKTNRKLITLKEGYNDFTITGATGSFSIEFDFRFKYL